MSSCQQGEKKKKKPTEKKGKKAQALGLALHVSLVLYLEYKQ